MGELGEAEDLEPNPIFQGWLALHGYREEDALEILKSALPETLTAGPVTSEYLFLLSLAYQRALARHRRKSDAIRSIDFKEGASEMRMLSLRERHDVESHLISLCWDMVFLLENKILPVMEQAVSSGEPEASLAEAMVFASTMKADFLRNLAEVQYASSARRQAASREAKAAFLVAMGQAEKFSLAANSATRLRCVANYSAMLGEDPKTLKEALQVLDDALGEWEQHDRREQERASLLGAAPKKQQEGDQGPEGDQEGAQVSAWPPGEEDMEKLRSAMSMRAAELRDRIAND